MDQGRQTTGQLKPYLKNPNTHILDLILLIYPIEIIPQKCFVLKMTTITIPFYGRVL